LDQARLRFALVALFLLVIIPLTGHPLLEVHGLSSSVSQIYVSPLNSCCSNLPSGSIYQVNVFLNLTSGYVNTFDVLLNYSNIYNPTAPGVPTGMIRAHSIDYSNNVFTSLSPAPTAGCIDGFPFDDLKCPAEDTGLGFVHFIESAAGNGIQGPMTNALLFTITFSINGTGTSAFTFNRALLINPGLDSNGSPHPHYVQLVTRGGIFSNKGLAAYFNARPVNPPSILANGSVSFDATGTYDADNPSQTIINNTWDFGDGKPPLTIQSPQLSTPHTFDQPGSYTVKLTAADSVQKGSITEVVTVMQNLGILNLRVYDQQGSPTRGNVLVSIYNSSSSPKPFHNSTVNLAGIVIFSSLNPGDYFLTFSSQNSDPYSIFETVVGGWTTLDTIYVMVHFPPPPPPDYSGIVFTGSILAFIFAMILAMVLKRRSNGKAERSRAGSIKSSKKGAFVRYRISVIP